MISNKKVLGIIGPSGCGKSTIVEILSAKGIIEVNPTVTDRPPRTNEQSLEHKFVSVQEFDELIKNGKFLETVQPFGLKYRYGTPKLNLDTKKIPSLMLRAMFVPAMLTHYPNSIIYQIEASYKFASTNIKDRSDSEIGDRLSTFKSEKSLGKKYSSRVFENKGNLADITKDISVKLLEDFGH